MKKTTSILTIILICTLVTGALAGTWRVPGKNQDNQSSGRSNCGYGIQAELIEDLATRSGPSTQYTGCGSYKMKGQYVTVLSRAFDNGGVQWAQVEISYGGATRRMYTGVKRLNLSNRELSMIREEDMNFFLGYGVINGRVNPKWGPGSYYATYTDRTFYDGDEVAVINIENGYYQVECYHTSGEIFRCWIPAGNVCMY